MNVKRYYNLYGFPNGITPEKPEKVSSFLSYQFNFGDSFITAS